MFKLPEFVPIEAGALAARATRGRLRANVVACMPRSAYLQLGRTLVCVGTPSIGRGPLNIRLAPGVFEREFRPRLQPGAVIAFRRGVPDAVMILDLSSVPTWKPKLARSVLPQYPGLADDADRVDAARFGLAEAVFLADAPASRAGPRLTSVHAIWVAQFERGISALRTWSTPSQANDIADVPWAVLNALLGYGPGLTPAGDDALVGALIAMGRLGLVKHRNALTMVLAGYLDSRTNAISAAHLRAAFEGLSSEVVHDVVDSLLVPSQAPQRSPTGAVVALLSYGASSGRACCAGILAVIAGHMNRAGGSLG